MSELDPESGGRSSAKHSSASDSTVGDSTVGDSSVADGSVADSSVADGSVADEAYERPAGVSGSFEDLLGAPVQPSVPPTVHPALAQAFGRPPGAPEFLPSPGERMSPKHTPISEPVHPALSSAFGRSADASGNGFAPPPGGRLVTGAGIGSPWWQQNADKDPWRDPQSIAWLGRPAVFAHGAPAQLPVDEDTSTESEEWEEEQDEPDAEPAPAALTGRARFGLRAATLSTLIALIAGLVGGAGGYWLAQRGASMVHDSHVTLGTTGQPANRPPGSVAEIAKRVAPAVVSIDVRFSGGSGTGSGVIIAKEGYILTNNHVISAAASSGTITVTFNDGKTEAAKVVGRDTQTDLAVIKVTNSNITVAPLGDSSKVAVGDPVIAIGSPLGLTGTVTSGIVSALNRPVHLSGEGSDTDAVVSALQTDAAINPGNSGGALLDASGAVIGINSAIATLSTGSGSSSGSIGLGFAIPINFARTIATELIASGTATHATMGVSTRSVTDGTRSGAYVVQVSAGGPAEKAGIKPADVITAVDGSGIISSDMLAVLVLAHKPGDVLTVHLFRGTAEQDVKVTLGSS